MPARSGQQRSKWHCNRLLLVLLAGLLMQPLSSTALHGAASASNEKHPALESNDRLSIPSGSYHPFFKRTDGVLTIPVAAFDLDAAPVTKSQYLEFVRQHLGWRKSHVKALVAERNYLSDWSGDLDPGENLQAPVTYVSWFAARAYCSEHGRLPSVAEWERVAGATQTAPYSQDATDAAKPFQFAMGKLAADVRAMPLQFGAIWEWTEDFNSIPAMNSNESARPDSPLFCGDGFRSNDAADYAAFLRHSLRSSLRASYTLKNLGFRCAG